eukprot:88074-Pelagomonas_calceolata.AAC.4
MEGSVSGPPWAAACVACPFICLPAMPLLACGRREMKGKGNTAVPAYKGSLAEAEKGACNQTSQQKEGRP